jgi:hypothetical protein
MKRSRLGKTSLAAILVGLGLAGAVGGAALAEESTYQPWSGAQATTGQQTTAQQLKKLTTDLNTLIKKAETANAADPNFLTDLKKLVSQYDGSAASSFPPGTVFLSDNFTDGNYTTNPTWKVSAGTWNVDTGGKNKGLVSKIGGQNNKVSGNDVLKAILGVQEPAQQQTYASIYTPATIGNAFKMTMKLTTNTDTGAFNIGPYQGASAGTAYRLVYQPGNADAGLVLQRVANNQVTEVGAYNDPINLNDGNVHEVVWSRDAKGKMRVIVDGQQLIIATDTKVAGNLDGWLNINQGGSYWIRDLKIEAL